MIFFYFWWYVLWEECGQDLFGGDPRAFAGTSTVVQSSLPFHHLGSALKYGLATISATPENSLCLTILPSHIKHFVSMPSGLAFGWIASFWTAK